MGLDPGPTGMIISRKTKVQEDGTGPLAGPSVMKIKPMVHPEEAGTHVGLGCTEGPG
jgi:hypothetical protein